MDTWRLAVYCSIIVPPDRAPYCRDHFAVRCVACVKHAFVALLNIAGTAYMRDDATRRNIIRPLHANVQFIGSFVWECYACVWFTSFVASLTTHSNGFSSGIFGHVCMAMSVRSSSDGRDQVWHLSRAHKQMYSFLSVNLTLAIGHWSFCKRRQTSQLFFNWLFAGDSRLTSMVVSLWWQ